MPITYLFGEECFTYRERERQDFRATSGNLQDTSNFLLKVCVWDKTLPLLLRFWTDDWVWIVETGLAERCVQLYRRQDDGVEAFKRKICHQQQVTNNDNSLWLPIQDRMSTHKMKVCFKGILANVDSSISQMSFGHGFKVESFSEEEATELFSALEKIPAGTAAQKYFLNYQCFNIPEQRMYVISNSFGETSDPDSLFSEIVKFDNALVWGYLEPIFRLMRLFKEGDIRMPVKFFCRVRNDKIRGTRRIESGRFVSNEPYHLETSEIQVLGSFLENVKLPFKRDFLDLAFENFELSYESSDMQLAFLLVMIGLETLLNPSQDEVRHRVSRNLAVLLGDSREDSVKIFAEAKELYGKRSDVVHSGKRRIIKKEDLLRSRDYLRRAIKETYRIDKAKEEIVTLLDSHGFGEPIERHDK